MGRLAFGTMFLVVWATLVGSLSAASPRVLIELAYVVRTQEKPGETTLKEEIEAAIKTSKVADQGMNAFLDEWLADQDRAKFDIECLRIKGPLGEELELQTQRSSGDDPSGEIANTRLTGLPAMAPMGLLFTVTSKEAEEGKIELDFEIRKRFPRADLGVSGPDGRTVFGMQSFMVYSKLTLEPGMPEVAGGLASDKRGKDDREVRESVAILRVQRVSGSLRRGG